MNKEELQLISFNMIAHIGEAKRLFMEAIELSEKKIDSSKVFQKGEEQLKCAHKAHFDVIQKEANGENIEFSIMLMHAEDQLMTVELLKELSKKIIHINQKIN